MRIQVNLSDDLVAQMDKYADIMGVSRSALAAMFIGQGIMGYNKAYEVLDNLGDKITTTMFVNESKK